VKKGDLVKIFAASKQPLGMIVGFHSAKSVLVFWNNGLHWIGKSQLEVINGD